MSAPTRTTIAACLQEIAERHRLLLLGAMWRAAALHTADDRGAVAAWYLVVADLLAAAGAQRHSERPTPALDAVGLLNQATVALHTREIDAIAAGLLLALEDVPGTAHGDLLYHLVLLLDEEKTRRRTPAGANEGWRHPLSR
jgi:hypothetical protein